MFQKMVINPELITVGENSRPIGSTETGEIVLILPIPVWGTIPEALSNLPDGFREKWELDRGMTFVRVVPDSAAVTAAKAEWALKEAAELAAIRQKEEARKADIARQRGSDYGDWLGGKD